LASVGYRVLVGKIAAMSVHHGIVSSRRPRIVSRHFATTDWTSPRREIAHSAYDPPVAISEAGHARVRRTVSATPSLRHSACAAVLLTLSGCGRPVLSNDDAASLIKQYRTDHCNMVSRAIQPADVGAQDAAGIIAVLLKEAHVDRKDESRVNSDFGDYRTEKLTVQQGDDRQSAVLTELHYPGTPRADKIVLRACLFVPLKIEISDLVLESPTTAHVLFTEHQRLSLLGKELARYPNLADMAEFAPAETHAFRMRLATMNLGPKGWYVESIGTGT